MRLILHKTSQSKFLFFLNSTKINQVSKLCRAKNNFYFIRIYFKKVKILVFSQNVYKIKNKYFLNFGDTEYHNQQKLKLF